MKLNTILKTKLYTNSWKIFYDCFPKIIMEFCDIIKLILNKTMCRSVANKNYPWTMKFLVEIQYCSFKLFTAIKYRYIWWHK